MFEFTLTLGPLTIRLALTTPDATEHAEVLTDTELAEDDDWYEQETAVGFRG